MTSIQSRRQSHGALYLSLRLYDDFPYKGFVLFQVQVVNISQSHAMRMSKEGENRKASYLHGETDLRW